MKHVRISIKYLLRIVAGIFFFLGAYFLAAGVCCCIPVNTDYTPQPDGIPIAIISNGVHTDIAVPVRTAVADWTQQLSFSDAKEADSTYRWLSFGWGDKGFYLETPTWADLKASTAFKAAFWLSTSAMHVTWRKALPPAGPRCRILTLSREKYAALCSYIRETFREGADRRFRHIVAPTYGTHDAFYEAKGTYNLFKTCNVWTGEGLKTAGVRVALWTPFEKGLLEQLP